MHDIQIAAEISTAAIKAAQDRITSVIKQTPLELNQRLSEYTNTDFYLKREDLQIVRSYKIRGAYNAVSQLTSDMQAAGVVCASAGNHAQGVAFACNSLQIYGKIFVPENTPKQKLERIKYFGRKYVQLLTTGKTYDEASLAAYQEVKQTGATMIHPFDSQNTVIGQGTLALEIVEQLGKVPDVVLVPVGGGGCIAGMLSYLTAINKKIKVIGVEPLGAASMTAALLLGKVLDLQQIDTFVDGAALKRVGKIGFEILKKHRAKILDPLTTKIDLEKISANTLVTKVPEGAICTTMLELYQNEGIITEPAGALASALVPYIKFTPGSTVVSLISGGNNDVSRYAEILERSLVHLGLKHYFLVSFSQEPGALRSFLDNALGPEDDITLFEYVKRNNRETGSAIVGIEIAKADDLNELLKRMEKIPFPIKLLKPGSLEYELLT